MDLDFSDEQLMLRDMVRGVCEQYSPLTVVRELEDDPVGYTSQFWKQLAELDLIGLTLPTEYGGAGQSCVEAAIVYEEFGRALAPSPLFVSSVMSAGVLIRAGTEAQREEWLPRLARGDVVFTPAWLEPGNGYAPKGVQARAEATPDGYVISGVKRHVEFASSAERLVVLARTGDAETEIDLFLVDPDATGVALEQKYSIASDTQYDVRLDAVTVAESDRVGAAGSGWSTWTDTLLDGYIALAAAASGGARCALEFTTQYAKDREQFDKPLGAFQALAHYLADADTAVEGGTTLTYEAAWARATGRPVQRLAPMAKLFACKTFRDVTATGQQIFGGVGFTLEYDIQLYFRRAKRLQLAWSDDRTLEDRIAAAVLGD